MVVLRRKMNEMVINDCMTGKMNGYKSYFNGMFVFQIENCAFYGGWILRYPNEMGDTIIHLDEKSIERALNAIEETYENLYKIYLDKKRYDNYCVNNPWTYSGT